MQIILTDNWWLPTQLECIDSNMHILLRSLSILLSVMEVHYAELTLLTELHLHSLDSIVFDDTLATVLGRLHNFEIQCPEINQPKVSFQYPISESCKTSLHRECICYLQSLRALPLYTAISWLYFEYYTGISQWAEMCLFHERGSCKMKVPLSGWSSMEMSTCSQKEQK